MIQFEESGFGYDLRCLMLQDQLNVMIPQECYKPTD